jgi:hypothetical protein
LLYLASKSSQKLINFLKWIILRWIFRCKELVAFLPSLQSDFYPLRHCCHRQLCLFLWIAGLLHFKMSAIKQCANIQFCVLL